MKTLMLLLLAAAIVLSVSAVPAAAEEPRSSLYVKNVENLPEDFIFGMDVSSVLAEEASGVKYFDFSGNETDLFRILADFGINTIRVRVWNNPFDDEGHGFGGAGSDILFQGAQVQVKGDHLQAGFPDQPGPIQLSALSHGHSCSPGQHPDSESHGMDHKAAELNGIVAGRFYGGQGFPGLGLCVHNGSQHKLLYCFFHDVTCQFGQQRYAAARK